MLFNWCLFVVVVWATTLLDMHFTFAQCSMRNDSSDCYPGICAEGMCLCSPGFTGANCRTLDVDQASVLTNSRGTLYSGLTRVEIHAVSQEVYINVKNLTSLNVSWTTFYQPDNLPNLNDVDEDNEPVYPNVREFSLSIVSSFIHIFLWGDGRTNASTSFWYCPEAGSLDSPVAVAVCNDKLDKNNLQSWIPANGYELQYCITVNIGGYLKLFNGGSIITQKYTQKIPRLCSIYTFDFDDPYHCVSSGCRTTMLDAGNDVTSEPTITITWQNWTDDLAGIKEYVLQVRQLSGSHSSKMTENFDIPPVYVAVTNSSQTVTLPIPSAGVYSIILTVTDNAGNSRLSRRFVFFDNDRNDVTIQNEFPLRVLSATSETGYKWLTKLDPSGGLTLVDLDWTNHFVNLPHHNQGLLKPIGSYVGGTIEMGYDQNFGKRGLESIPNAFGVTQFRVFHDIDHSGGRTIVNVSDDNSDNWRNENTSTQATFDLNLVDGDSIRFWVEARDIAGHFVRDDVVIHADRSPPIIEELQVVPEWSAGRSEPCFLSTCVEFRTYDVHSGLRSIEWRLFHNSSGTEVDISRMTLDGDELRKDVDDCDPGSCKCVPVGDCYNVDYIIKLGNGIGDIDFFITLSVTNHARLVATKTVEANVMVTSDNVGQVAESLESLTSNISSADSEALDSVADLLDDIVDTQDVSQEVTTNVLLVVNNLLEVNSDKLNDTKTASRASSRIVQALEGQMSNVLAAGKNFSEAASSLAVIARNFNPADLAGGVAFAALQLESNSFADYDIKVYRGLDEEIPMDRVDTSIKLPQEIVEKFPPGDPVPINFIVYENSNLFRSGLIGSPQSADVRSYVGSRVISASVLNVSVDNLPQEQPVVSVFRLTPMASQDASKTVQCVFWDFTLRDGIGNWSTEGCRLNSSTEGRAECHCNHTTNFAVLVNIHGEYANPGLDIFSKIGCSVSILALVITIVIHCSVRSLQAKTSSRILISFSASLLCLYIAFLAGVEQTSSRVGCIIAAVLLHYFALTSMAWMGVEATNMYVKLVRVFNAYVKNFMVLASIIAWGYPIVVVGAILVADYTVYKGNGHSCFLKPGSAFYYGHLLIIGLVLLFNAIIFVMVVRKLTWGASKIKSSADRNRRAKILRRLQNIVAISVLLGLTWSFGLLSTIESASFVFQVLFCVFNSLQGLFIFLLFGVRQGMICKHVRSRVKRKQSVVRRKTLAKPPSKNKEAGVFEATQLIARAPTPIRQNQDPLMDPFLEKSS